MTAVDPFTPRDELLLFRVVGTPAPQGSKRHVGNGVMVESSAKAKPWRLDVKSAALDEMGEHFSPFLGAVELTVFFTLARPKAHYRADGRLRADAPTMVPKRPDLDKLIRSTLDALGEAGVWRDDSQVAVIHASKSYVGPLLRTAGATITVGEVLS